MNTVTNIRRGRTVVPLSTPAMRVIAQHHADAADERSRMLAGLLERPARIDPKHLYDALGAALYGAITRLDEYYPTRTEARILARSRDQICAELPRHPQWIDLGCGDGEKSAAWLAATQARRYIGVDIAEAWLRGTLATLGESIEAVGVIADFSKQWSMVALLAERPGAPPVFFYPGSSIGNFAPPQARGLLQNIRAHCHDGGCLLIGVDFVKDRRRLIAAYDDAIGVTAAFNRNVLRVANRQLKADFKPEMFEHVALFNEIESRIEMHLMSRREQTVSFGAPAMAQRNFEVAETIITEYSYKYSAERFSELLTMAGFTRQKLWTDASGDPANAAYGVFLAMP